jgi:hypothetical protein
MIPMFEWNFMVPWWFRGVAEPLSNKLSKLKWICQERRKGKGNGGSKVPRMSAQEGEESNDVLHVENDEGESEMSLILRGLFFSLGARPNRSYLGKSGQRTFSDQFVWVLISEEVR